MAAGLGRGVVPPARRMHSSWTEPTELAWLRLIGESITACSPSCWRSVGMAHLVTGRCAVPSVCRSVDRCFCVAVDSF